MPRFAASAASTARVPCSPPAMVERYWLPAGPTFWPRKRVPGRPILRPERTVGRMDYGDLVVAVEGELGALAAAVGEGSGDARVPTCPDFSLADLAVHVGEFCGFWSHVLAEGTGRPKPPFVPVGDGADSGV